MIVLQAERRLELVALIDQVVQNSDLLHSKTNKQRNIAKSIWGHFVKLTSVVERMVVGNRDRKEQFYSYLSRVHPREIGVNLADLKQAVEVLKVPEMKRLTFEELKYVLSWIRRMTESA